MESPGVPRGAGQPRDGLFRATDAVPSPAMKKVRRASSSKARLEALAREALVDTYGEEEQLVAFGTVVMDEIECPFRAKVIGEEVEVVSVNLSKNCHFMNATCRHRGKTYRVDLASLEPTGTPPKGFEWYEAYLHWLGDGG